MNEQSKDPPPLSSEAILANRPFAALSDAEKAAFAAAHRAETRAVAQIIVDNLNRKVLARKD